MSNANVDIYDTQQHLNILLEIFYVNMAITGQPSHLINLQHVYFFLLTKTFRLGNTKGKIKSNFINNLKHNTKILFGVNMNESH